MSAAIALANRSVIRQHREPSTMILRKRIYHPLSSPLFLPNRYISSKIPASLICSSRLINSYNAIFTNTSRDKTSKKFVLPMCACNYFSRVSSRKGGSLLIKREGLVVNRLNRRTTLERLLGGTDFFTDLMHRSFSKSRRLYILPDLNPPRISSDAPTRLSPRKAYSRLFVSSHRVLTLRDGRCRGDNISTIG